jgi:hypothetical protein
MLSSIKKIRADQSEKDPDYGRIVSVNRQVDRWILLKRGWMEQEYGKGKTEPQIQFHDGNSMNGNKGKQGTCRVN